MVEKTVDGATPLHLAAGTYVLWNIFLSTSTLIVVVVVVFV